MADLNEQMVLTKEGLATLTKELLKVVNERIKERIVTTIDDESDEKHIPSAQTVNDTIAKINNIVSLVIADGDIGSAQITPNPKNLYMVRKSEEDKEGVPYVYIEGVGFIAACALSTMDNVPDLKALTDEEITNVVSEAANETKPEL